MPSHAWGRRREPGSIRGASFASDPSPEERAFMTRRQRMKDLLASREDGFSLEEIEDIFDLTRSRALDELRHIHKSLRRAPEHLMMVPPRCDECDYVFQAEEPRAPGRCPRCKSERVADPVFKVGKAEA